MPDQFDSYTLADKVREKMQDIPSHTVVDLETVMGHALHVLDEWGFLDVVEKKEDDE